LAWLLVLLACLVAPVAVLAGWARWNVLEADRYVGAVRQLAADPAVQDAVIALAETAFAAGAGGTAGEAAVATAGDVTAVPAANASGADEPPAADLNVAPRSVALPPPPVLAVEPAAAAAQPESVATAARQVAEAVAAAVRSDAFVAAWAEANRAVQAALTNPNLTGQPIALDLSPFAAQVADQLGPRALGALPDPAALRVQLTDAPVADRLRTVLTRVRWLGVALPVAAVLLAVLAIVVAPNRLPMLRRLGFGVVLTTVATLLALLVAATAVEGRAPEPAAAVVGAVIAAVLQTPTLWLAMLAAAGLVVAALGVLVRWLGRRRSLPSAPG
jgi:hypothetical protein